MPLLGNHATRVVGSPTHTLLLLTERVYVRRYYKRQVLVSSLSLFVSVSFVTGVVAAISYFILLQFSIQWTKTTVSRNFFVPKQGNMQRDSFTHSCSDTNRKFVQTVFIPLTLCSKWQVSRPWTMVVDQARVDDIFPSLAPKFTAHFVTLCKSCAISCRRRFMAK